MKEGNNMPRVLYFDCFSGISGDMTVAALLGLGVDFELFKNELAKLGIKGYTINFYKKMSNGICVNDFNVISDENLTHYHEKNNPHEHNHIHGHNHHHVDGQNHHHDNHNKHSHHHSHTARNLYDIEKIIDNSTLNDKVKSLSKKIFREVAAAEASVHNKSIDDIHFHEVGALDSIIDIVGTAICIEALKIDKVYCSVLHEGSGFIKCQHGILPVPVPAVAKMLEGTGIPVVQENISTELITPTGMAIIKVLASYFGVMPEMIVCKVSYGSGKRETGRLNALRIFLGETTHDGNANKYNDEYKEDVLVLETNIDDMTSEALAYTAEKLFDRGALDVFFTPVYMKKGRPAVKLSVISKPDIEKQIIEVILSETTTLGIRRYETKRYCMNRETLIVQTTFGKVRVKRAWAGNIEKFSPEYEDCREIAQKHNIPIQEVFDDAKRCASKYTGKSTPVFI